MAFILGPSPSSPPRLAPRHARRKSSPPVVEASLHGPDARIAVAEHTWLAHELHDGVIQNLSGVSLQLAALREQPLPDSELQARLAQTHDLVRQCLGELRELITRTRPLTLDVSHLPEAIADEARRFERDTGIRAQYVCHGSPPRLADEACAQIVRIAQEALTNVRRHSGAANVAVVLVCDPTQVHLIVDDDGRGFPFAGRWEHEQLERSRRGPLVIRERVRLLGGTLLIVSAPGSGARVEVTIPSPASA